MAITFDDEDITPASTITLEDEIADQQKATSSITFDDEVEKKSTITFDDEEEELSAGDIVKGVGVEVGAGVGGSVIGGIIGGTLGSVIPGAGTAAGAVIGASLGGATASFFGSLLAQDIEGQEDKSMGRALAAAAIGAVPGGVGKGIKGSMTLGKVATREAAKGAAFGVTDATARAVIDEGRLPTAGELAQFGGAGALFGGALGGVTTKIGRKFAGKTPQQIDDAIAREEITFKDLSFFPKQVKVKRPASKPKDALEGFEPAEYTYRKTEKGDFEILKDGESLEGMEDALRVKATSEEKAKLYINFNKQADLNLFKYQQQFNPKNVPKYYEIFLPMTTLRLR